MGSVYLQTGEYGAYGVAGAQASDVAAASVLVDAYLQRPEGLVWTPDADGWPCFMAALSAGYALTAPGAIATGSNVVVPVTGMITPDLVGEVLVLDRANAGSTEACVVAAVAAGSVTLRSVKHAHNAGCVLEQGMVVLEERALPANRSVTQLRRPQVARIIAAQGRYAYGRRSQQQSGVFAVPSILASVQLFGGPPAWYDIDVNMMGLSRATGEAWVPPGNMVAQYSDVRVRYVAGFPAAGLPDVVKRATATLVGQMQQFPELSGNIRSLQAGQTKIERFADNMLDAQTRGQLASFAAFAWA